MQNYIIYFTLLFVKLMGKVKLFGKTIEATAEKQRSNSRAKAEQQRSDSRATVERQRSNIGETAEKQQSYS